MALCSCCLIAKKIASILVRQLNSQGNCLVGEVPQTSPTPPAYERHEEEDGAFVELY